MKVLVKWERWGLGGVITTCDGGLGGEEGGYTHLTDAVSGIELYPHS